MSGVRKTERDKISTRRLSRTVPGSLSASLIRSRSISLSSSPDKSEAQAVGIVKNLHRVGQTEPSVRKYCMYIVSIVLHDLNLKYSLDILQNKWEVQREIFHQRKLGAKCTVAYMVVIAKRVLTLLYVFIISLPILHYYPREVL